MEKERMDSLSVGEVANRLGAFKKGISLFVLQRGHGGYVGTVVDVRIDSTGLPELIIEEVPGDESIKAETETNE